MARMIQACSAFIRKNPNGWSVWGRRAIFRLIRVVAIAYVATGLILILFQSCLLYWPISKVEITPADLRLPFESVHFTSVDGVKLHGWFIAAEKPIATLLFCHGNGGNISHRMPSIWLMNSMGISTMIFDYRGYGLSEGKPSEQGTYLDAEAAWKHLTEERGIAQSQIVIFGRSLGGAIAAKLASDHHPASLIIDSSFTSVPDRAAELFWMFPVRPFARFDYNTAQQLGLIDCPVLIVHSPTDKLMPFKHGTSLFTAAREPKQFLERQGEHNDGLCTSNSTTLEVFRRFISATAASD